MAELAPPKYRRVLLQIDAATHCRETVGAAIEITARLGGELRGIFIEDSDLFTVGELDFIREFRLSSPIAHHLDRLTLEAQLRAMARSVKRQLEQAARHRKITVGFRALRGEGWRGDVGEWGDADLVILECTGRLHARNFRGRLSSREAITELLHPTLLLKGAKSLRADVTVICDSLTAAKQGILAAVTLLGAPAGKITLLPVGLNDEDCAELTMIAQQYSGEKQGTPRVAPVMAAGPEVIEAISPIDCTVVMRVGGAFLEDPAHQEALLISRHPLLFVR